MVKFSIKKIYVRLIICIVLLLIISFMIEKTYTNLLFNKEHITTASSKKRVFPLLGNKLKQYFKVEETLEIDGLYLYTYTYRRFNKNNLLVSITTDSKTVLSTSISTQFLVDNGWFFIPFKEFYTVKKDYGYFLSISQVKDSSSQTIAVLVGEHGDFDFKLRYKAKSFGNVSFFNNILKKKTGVFTKYYFWFYYTPLTLVLEWMLVCSILILVNVSNIYNGEKYDK
jgi:hypothetical protein